MASSYVGDSPGKKVTRLRSWLSAARWMKAFRQPFNGALVLAGEGGDISTLRGLGVDPARISAVDLDSENAMFVRELHPESSVFIGEAGEVSSKCPPYNTAHLDFNNGITVDNLLTIRKVIDSFDTFPAYLSVTMMKGRETGKDDKQPLLPTCSRQKRKFIKRVFNESNNRIAQHLVSPGPLDIEYVLKVAEEELDFEATERKNLRLKRDSGTWVSKTTGKLTSLGTGMVRARVIQEAIHALVWQRKIYDTTKNNNVYLQPASMYTYHSRSKHTGGTPFMTVGWVVYPITSHQYIETIFDRYYDVLFSAQDLPASVAPHALKHFALDMSHGGFTDKDIANALDISPGTVTAWKAHQTMGTYVEKRLDLTRRLYGISYPHSSAKVCSAFDGWGKTGAQINGEVYCIGSFDRANLVQNNVEKWLERVETRMTECS